MKILCSGAVASRLKRPLLRAAIWGFAVNTAFLAAFQIGAHFWGAGTAGEFWPDFFLGFAFVLSAPTGWLFHLLGFSEASLFGLFAMYLVNGLIVALVFAGARLVWNQARSHRMRPKRLKLLSTRDNEQNVRRQVKSPGWCAGSHRRECENSLL